MRPDGLADGDGSAEIDQAPALFDVQLDVGAEAGESRRLGTEVPGVVVGAAHGLVEGQPLGVAERPGPVGVQGAGEQPAAGAGDPEAGTLLVGEGHDRHRAVGGTTAGPQGVEGREGRHDPERPVEGSAVGDGVEVAADGQHVVGGGVAPPGPEVAGAVRLDGQPPVPGRVREPVPHRQVGVGPGEPVVAAGPPVAPDRLDRVPHVGEGHAVTVA